MISNRDFEKVIKEIDDYIKKTEQPFKNIKIEKQKRYEKHLYNLEYFYFVTNYISSMRFEAKKNEVLINLFTKSALDLYGIFYCLKNGLEIQAQEIARCLYETYLTVELLTKEDIEARLKLFNDFQHVQRGNQLKFHKETDPNADLHSFGLSNEYIESIEKKYIEVKDNYNPKNPINWAWFIFKDKLKKNQNPTLLDICKYLGNDYVKEYIITYPTLSITTHPSQILIEYYTNKIDDGCLTVVNSPRYSDLIVSTSSVSLMNCAKITENILKYFKVYNYEELIGFIEYFLYSDSKMNNNR